MNTSDRPGAGAIKRVRSFLNARDFMGAGEFIDDQVTGASDHDPVVELTASDLRALLSRIAVLEGALTKAALRFDEIREGCVVQDSAFWNEATINGAADIAEEAASEARSALQTQEG